MSMTLGILLTDFGAIKIPMGKEFATVKGAAATREVARLLLQGKCRVSPYKAAMLIQPQSTAQGLYTPGIRSRRS